MSSRSAKLARASPGSDVIPNPLPMCNHYQNFVLVKGLIAQAGVREWREGLARIPEHPMIVRVPPTVRERKRREDFSEFMIIGILPYKFNRST